VTRFVTINGKNVTSTLAKFLVIIGVNFGYYRCNFWLYPTFPSHNFGSQNYLPP